MKRRGADLAPLLWVLEGLTDCMPRRTLSLFEDIRDLDRYFVVGHDYLSIFYKEDASDFI
jgi:hypothetical protein